jgi:outer membrane receptor protein involved in Fe transport
MYDPSQSDLFEYNENTEALYVSGNKKFGKNKWEIQIGLRMESTQTVGNSISYNQITKYDYTNFFPTTYLSYAPIENHNFSLNYSKRISRPGFNELNPFKWYSTPYSYSEGNPYLRPTYTNNLEFNYSYKDYLYTTVYYSKSVDNSGQVVLLNGNDYTQKITRLNYFDGFTTGIQQVCVFKKVKWLESQNSLSVYFQHSDSKIDPITPKTTEGFGASIMTSNTFTLNKEKTILSGFDLQYNSPHKSNDLVYNYSSTRLNVYVRMFFLNKNLQLSLVGNNLLKAYDFNNTSNRNNIEARYSGYYDSRYFRLSLTYKFGNSKINVNQRKISNEDEKGRAK